MEKIFFSSTMNIDSQWFFDQKETSIFYIAEGTSSSLPAVGDKGTDRSQI